MAALRTFPNLKAVNVPEHWLVRFVGSGLFSTILHPVSPRRSGGFSTHKALLAAKLPDLMVSGQRDISRKVQAGTAIKISFDSWFPEYGRRRAIRDWLSTVRFLVASLRSRARVDFAAVPSCPPESNYLAVGVVRGFCDEHYVRGEKNQPHAVD
jgi:hypothetical protein